MDMSYFMKVQNAYGTQNKREKELIKVNHEMSKHFDDTFGTEDVLINGVPKQLMIIKDTDNNTHKKKIKSVHDEKFNLGDYVIWNGQVWLIALLDSDERTWNRGYMFLCTVLLSWQNADGDIVERWGYEEDYTKYSNGVEGNKVLFVGDNQYGITLPVDDETKQLKRDKRFVIDLDGIESPDVYKLTNRKVKLRDDSYFGRGALINLTLSYTEFNPNADKRVEMPDGREVWICDYISPDDPKPPVKTDILSKIEYASTDIKVGTSGRKFYAKFVTKDSEEVADLTPSWTIEAEFISDLVYSTQGDYISIATNNEDLIDRRFKLKLTDTTQQANADEIILTITGLFR